DHRSRREPFRLRGPDVVLAQRLEHGRADEPAVAGDADADERDHRQDEMPGDISDHVQRVCPELRPELWRVERRERARGHDAARWEPAERDREYEDQDQGEPEP